MERPGAEAGSFPFLTYFLSIRDGAKLICHAGKRKIVFVLRGVASFPRIWGVDRFSRCSRFEVTGRVRWVIEQL
jgi:hypothetical protein